MSEYYRNISVNPTMIQRIEASLALPGKQAVTSREKADVLIEDALQKRKIAEAGKALEEKIENDDSH